MRARFSARVRLVQFISDLVYADAVSSDCLELHRVFQRWGFEAAIYAGRRDSHHQRVAQELSAYRYREGDLVLFHYSAWSGVAQFLLELGKPLVLAYHNITPPEFFGRVSPQAREVAQRGIDALPRFVPLARLALGDSEFNRQELEGAGFKTTGVMPILVDFQRLDGEPNREILRDYDDDYVNFLFVGRVDPNKRQEDIIKLLYYYRRCNPKSRLFLVGAHSPGGPYHAWMQGLVDHLGLRGDVHFTGQTSHRDLLSFYRLADFFVCMSEHEGFCVPIVESMYLGIPVVAYAAAAVPHTMGQAGVLVKRKDYGAIAELIQMVTSDRALRSRLVARGRERARDFSRERVEQILAGYIAQVLQDV
ncbi:MAG: glycosyltransferase [Dehalococcoidia bacterium]|nr:glycosyltransferase [Dehalococcoidia bacterium]